MSHDLLVQMAYCLAKIATFVASVASSLKAVGLENKTQIRHFVNWDVDLLLKFLTS